MSMSKKRKELTELPPPPPHAKRRKESHHDKSEFRIVNASLVLSVPPVFAANPLAGVQEMLDSMVMRCAFFSFQICVVVVLSVSVS